MIAIENLGIQQGGFALRGVGLTVPEGKYGILMGRTGCGKTTVLECVCGLREPCAGGIRLGRGPGREAVDVGRLPPADRNVGYVPQEGALFVTKTVREHLAFALRVRRWSKADIAARVEELTELLGLGALLDRLPAGLSGGERQRVALGRALSFRPGVLCLDEPLSALDDQTRAAMYEMLRRAQRHEGVTALHVTHSREEAKALGDVVFRLEEGRVTREGAGTTAGGCP